ncbi:MAG TPA: hypothetical protein ENK88_01365, partial [Campylobacterales bacterium]|nr:hypothetical protein [Campylobacterales bacterium]
MARFIKDIQISDDWDTTTFANFDVKSLIITSEDNEEHIVPFNPSFCAYAWKFTEEYRCVANHDLPAEKVEAYKQLQITSTPTLSDVANFGYNMFDTNPNHSDRPSYYSITTKAGNGVVPHVYDHSMNYFCYDQFEDPETPVHPEPMYGKMDIAGGIHIQAPSGTPIIFEENALFTRFLEIDAHYYTSHITVTTLPMTRQAYLDSIPSSSDKPESFDTDHITIGLYHPAGSPVYNLAKRETTSQSFSIYTVGSDTSSFDADTQTKTEDGSCIYDEETGDPIGTNTTTLTVNGNSSIALHLARPYISVTSLHYLPFSTSYIINPSATLKVEYSHEDPDSGCENYEQPTNVYVNQSLRSVHYFLPSNESGLAAFVNADPTTISSYRPSGNIVAISSPICYDFSYNG